LPPQPPACSATNCHANCPHPTADATCGSDGVWQISRSASLHELAPILCHTTITGNLTGGSSDLLSIDNCGLLSVLGTTTFTGTPQLRYDFRGVGGTVARSYNKFMTFGHPATSAIVFQPSVINVWSPTVQLCSKEVTGATVAFLYLYDCAIATPNVTAIPSHDYVVASEPGHPVFNYNLAQDGDINNPNFTGAVPVSPRPPGHHPSPSSPETHHLAGWAVFLIVLAVLVVIALIIGLIAYSFVKRTAGSETV